MKRCDHCLQEVDPTLEDYTADRMFLYKTAHALVKELYTDDEDDDQPEAVDVLHVAIFLAGDDVDG